MPAVTFGLDISHHQNAALDLARCRREGIEFVILKATEGSGFTDSEFAANLAEARRAGLLVAAYHYQRPGSAAAQLARIRQVVPLDVPVVLDVEAGSGSVALTRDLVGRLHAAGYRVPLTYLPRWYWQQIGSPSLAGLPPLWSSRYPDNVVGSIADEWADVPAHYWTGYGGLAVALLQFTSSAAIAGHHPIDANAFRGTRAQLAALLGGEEDDMSEAAEEQIRQLHSIFAGYNKARLEESLPLKDVGRFLHELEEVVGVAFPPGIGERVKDLGDAVADLGEQLTQISTKVDQVAAGDVDYLTLAKAVNDLADQRRRDNNPATGPVS